MKYFFHPLRLNPKPVIRNSENNLITLNKHFDVDLALVLNLINPVIDSVLYNRLQNQLYRFVKERFVLAMPNPVARGFVAAAVAKPAPRRAPCR